MSTAIMQVGAVYLTPSGRLATLLRPAKYSRAMGNAHLNFVYLSRDGRRATEDGFSLQPHVAQRLLQMVARAGTVEA